MLIDFSAAQFFGPALTDEGRAAFEAATHHTIDQLEKSVEKRHVNTASDAVLLAAADAIDARPTVTVATMPLDEACSVIYVALQVCMPETCTVNHVVGYNTSYDIARFVRIRAMWNASYTNEAISHALQELRDHRNSLTSAQVDTLVTDAIAAAYQIKELRNQVQG